jgi:hypothetical protein
VGSFSLPREPLRARPALKLMFTPSDDADNELQELAQEVGRLERKLEAVMQTASLDAASVRAAISHTRLLCLPDGYRLIEVDEPPPLVDDIVEYDGRPFTVVRVGPSSFPDDPRRCAVLIRA